jgi:4-alpha-glucanotransferase
VEDLGYITADVRNLIEKLGLTGMRVLLFGLDDGPASPHNPQNYIKNCVVYTGTHDNNTIRGWFEKEAKQTQKSRLLERFPHKVSQSEIHWEVVRLAMSSIANTVIVPIQDILGLGAEARMNRPASVRGNWRWRLTPRQIRRSVSTKLARLMIDCKRA